MSYDRANKKLCEAIEALATSAHPTLQQRLAIAYLFHIRSVEPDELPIEVESQFTTLKEKFTRLATDSIPLQGAIEIAKELVSLSHIVAAEQHRVELRRPTSTAMSGTGGTFLSGNCSARRVSESEQCQTSTTF
jgi:hypothetical protein